MRLLLFVSQLGCLPLKPFQYLRPILVGDALLQRFHVGDSRDATPISRMFGASSRFSGGTPLLIRIHSTSDPFWTPPPFDGAKDITRCAVGHSVQLSSAMGTYFSIFTKCIVPISSLP